MKRSLENQTPFDSKAGVEQVEQISFQITNHIRNRVQYITRQYRDWCTKIIRGIKTCLGMNPCARDLNSAPG